MSQPLAIPVAHDFTCPWCWIALFQAKRLQAEFGVEIEWRGHELWPEELEWPEYRPAAAIPGRPPVLSRLDFLKMMDGIEVPTAERPKRMRVHAALEAVEFFKEKQPESVDAFVEAVYRAYWERAERIGDADVLEVLAGRFGIDLVDFCEALESRRYRDRVVHFDAPSYKVGVFNVPTFWIGGERYAEQPYVVLRKAMLAAGHAPAGLEMYEGLSFPPAPTDRPYIAINMVATIDGKILTGDRDEPVVDLGSENDHRLMKRIEAACDAVMVGAQTLRAAKKSWSPKTTTRIVVTRSGRLPFDSCFFAGKPVVASPGPVEAPEGIEQVRFNELAGLIGDLRKRGIERLLVLGGSSLNAELFEAGLVDEIFLTIAPKIRLGENVPTIADGNALPRESIQNYSIVEQHRIGEEFFLRYRRNP
ncbi:MAG TPA: dihydrofolate reductase family protein [Fimbriimonadaceae bacterium]|nr:dihydrofolate reductase family protein [Fimbriimonadaceae bacterium]